VLLVCILVWMLQPAYAQDGCGCDDEIEIDTNPPPEDEEPPPKKAPRKAPEKPPQRAGPSEFKPPSIQEVNAAIDKGVAWLKKAQKKDGSWGPCVSGGKYGGGGSGGTCYFTGPTSFSIFTLAKCGVSAKDPVIRKGLKWLRKRASKKPVPGSRFATYESASIVLMLAALNAPPRKQGAKPKLPRVSSSPLRPPPGSRFKKADWKWMNIHLQWLLTECQLRGGGWGYWRARGKAYHDLSATQFALLALRDAARAGYPVTKVAPLAWEYAAQAGRRFQHRDGAFIYKKSYPWAAGMCAAGIASLLICKEQMELAEQGVPSWLDSAVEKGLTFLGKHWDVEKNVHDEKARKKDQHVGYHFYHLYGIERVGALSGKREIGEKAWYPRGAAYLVLSQKDDGHWNDSTCMRPRDTLGTCFALLFLKKATPPTITRSSD